MSEAYCHVIIRRFDLEEHRVVADVRSGATNDLSHGLVHHFSVAPTHREIHEWLCKTWGALFFSPRTIHTNIRNEQNVLLRTDEVQDTVPDRPLSYCHVIVRSIQISPMRVIADLFPGPCLIGDVGMERGAFAFEEMPTVMQIHRAVESIANRTGVLASEYPHTTVMNYMRVRFITNNGPPETSDSIFVS